MPRYLSKNKCQELANNMLRNKFQRETGMGRSHPYIKKPCKGGVSPPQICKNHTKKQIPDPEK